MLLLCLILLTILPGFLGKGEETPWLMGICDQSPEFYNLKAGYMDFEVESPSECLKVCMSFNSSTRYSEEMDDAYHGKTSFLLLLRGPNISDMSLHVSSAGDVTSRLKRINLRMTALVRGGDICWNSSLRLRLEAYWFLNGKLEHIDSDIVISEVDDKPIESVWNSTLENIRNGTLRIIISTGLATLSLSKKSFDLLEPNVEFHCQSERKPACLPQSFERFRPLPAVFTQEAVELVTKVSSWEGNVTFMWIFSDGEHFMTSSSSPTSTKVHIFNEEGVHTLNVIISSGFSTSNHTFRVVAVKEIYISYGHDSLSPVLTEQGKLTTLPVSAVILTDDHWTLNVQCEPPVGYSTTSVTGNIPSCATVPLKIMIRFDKPGRYFCTIESTGGFTKRRQLHPGWISLLVQPRLESLTISTTRSVVATQSSILLTADVIPDIDCWITWITVDENGAIISNSSGKAKKLTHTFREPGFYTVKATASTPFFKEEQLHGEITIQVQDPIVGVNVVSPLPLVHLRVHSDVRFFVKPVTGTDVVCSWKLHCSYAAHPPPRQIRYLKDIESCDCFQRFPSPALCHITLTVYNEISRWEPRDVFRIYVEEPVSVLHFHVPEKVKSRSSAEVFIFLKNPHQSAVLVDVSVDSNPVEVIYDPDFRAYRASFVPLMASVRLVRLWARNNVSSVVLRKRVLAVEEVGMVDIVNSGCSTVGHPLRFLVFVNGTVPRMDDNFLYHWQVETDFDTQTFYTSVPIAESKVLSSSWNIKVTVKVNNGVSSRSASTSIQVSDIPREPCLLHDTVFRRGQSADIRILGLPAGLRFGNITLRIKQDRLVGSLLTEWVRYFDNMNTARWHYFSHSSGFHSVMGLLFVEHSDTTTTSSKHSVVRTGFLVTEPLYAVRIYAPRTVYLSRFPVSLTFRADVRPRSEGCVFRWELHGHTYVTATPQLSVHLHYLHGTYELQLTVRNDLGTSVHSSMHFEVAATLLLLNYTLSNFFARENGTISLEINQPSPPDTVFVDFGDDSVYDSNAPDLPDLGVLRHSSYSSNESSSVLALRHAYAHAGVYDVYVNVTSGTSGFEQWVSVVVEERISGAELVLLHPPTAVVELLEEVTVSCLMGKGTNLRFRWDFGDGTDGEQYTRQETYQVDRSKTNCTAHHSYGIANSYNVSVHIFNTYESVTAYLNVTIQAVERIVELHLHPRIRGRYAAPLYKKKNSDGANSSPYSTSPIEFETGLWRGSDVQFLFDFGDGNVKQVSSLLNAWSLPYAIVKHSYTAEGKYDVSVTATNLLSSVNASLGRPFYVQFPPENLQLDKLYYIIEHNANITLHATVSQGTNVSYSWKVGDMHMADAGSMLYLSMLNPGIYVVTVEAFNQVTDSGYNVVRRPNVTAKIYVQEKLLDIEVCVKVNMSEVCNLGVLDLPLDEEVHFRAKVFPSTETVLRFVWQLGIQEIRRTNVPFFIHKYQQAGWYSINVTAQNHISSISSVSLQLNLVQKVANLTSIFCQGPNLVNHPITYRAFYWFGTNLTFQWDFGDGSDLLTTSSSSVQHIYKEVGEYWVTVNVWNKFSHANITTNMFFLHHMCQKPEITFLHKKTRIAKYDDDVLIEADISIVCKTSTVEYKWTVAEADDHVINFDSCVALTQRQLVIPRNFLRPGNYNVYLKVNMVGTIVYAKSFTNLEIVLPHPFIYIEGGFVHWIGINDTRKLTARVMHLENYSHSLSYVWSCAPQIHKHLPCFKNSDFLNLNHSPELLISASAITPHLGSIIINVTLENNELLSASQLLEIKQFPHMLHVTVECEDCHDNHVNQHSKLQMRAICENCGSGSFQYHWKIWIIEDIKFRLHFGNYECVQADGSTFFIMAPNSTQEENLLNTTYLPNDYIEASFINISEDHMLAEKPYETVAEDLPPFPDLPGFPEENSTSEGQKLSRNARNTLDEELFESPDLIPPPQYPYEGDADYDYNSTFEDFPYPDFMPFPVPDLPLDGPNYLITEEGLPGESGSAAARHQSSQNLGIMLSEDEDQILEEAGKPRMKPGSTSILIHKSKERGDPLRDSLGRKFPAPHIVNRARDLLTLSKSTSTTGFNSEYLILKPGILKVGRSYLVQAKIVNEETGEEGFAMEYFKVNIGPINGRCTLMPLDGYSINFDFRLHCLEWKSDHFPLYYELSYSRVPNDIGHLIYFGLNENVKFNLPSGFVSDSHKVYLNVVVRDNLGVPTKVCSIVRQVKPSPTNITVEHIVYNETFHPKASLKKLIGEQNIQAILHKLHVLTSSLNNHESTSNHQAQSSDPELFSIKSKIRQRFFEIINDLRLTSKVEATQLMSVLNEIIDVQTINLFELQKAYNIYKKINGLQSGLSDFFASDQMYQEFLIFLSKLSFAAHNIHPQNDELIEISRSEIIKEMNNLLSIRLKIEEPLKVNIPHLSATAFFANERELHLKSFILLKESAIQLLDNSHFLSEIKRKTTERCPHDECLVFVAQEYDYITTSSSPNIPDFLGTMKSSIFLSLDSFDNLKNENNPSLNVSVHFYRKNRFENVNKVTLGQNFMNIHIVNLTDDSIHHSLLFYVKMDFRNLSQHSNIDIMFRYSNYPTLTRYDLKRSFSAGTSEMNVMISPDKIKNSGLYYIAVLSNNFLDRKITKEVMWEYEAFLFRDVCLGKLGGFWSPNSCYVMETTNYNSTHCKCSSNEMTAFSVPLEWELSLIPVNDLIEPYFNPLPLLALLSLFFLYFVLIYLNYQRDKFRNLSLSPIPLQDNNAKHKQLYLVYITTGFYFSSGTTASIFIVLHGTKDVTETRQLIGKENKKFCFQKGSVDIFLLSTEKNLGPLLKLEVWHDNEGVSPSWYLKTIFIKDLHTGASYFFSCNSWLSAERGDGLIEREFTVTENPPLFTDVFNDNLIMCMNDFNMWNALVCETPVSYFTGVQRITCCMCFFLNSAYLLSFFTVVPQETEDITLPHITLTTFLVAIITSLITSIPQILCTILFRFSKQPSIVVNPKFVDLFHLLSPFSFNCWLKHKRSTSSRSTGRSPSSVAGSDSLYSSFEESSVISLPDLMEESLSLEGEEKNVLPLSFSCSDLSDPVSPLQKTLSTWQTLENWLKKKHDLILKPDAILMKRQPYTPQSSSREIDERSLNSYQDDDSSQAWQQNSILSENSNIDCNIVSGLSGDIDYADKEFNLNFCFPCFHQSFYYFGWFVLVADLVGTSVFVLMKASRFSIPHSILFLKNVLISSVCSCLFITPFMILVYSVLYSIHSFALKKKYSLPEIVETPEKKKTLNKVDFNASNHRRMEYFKKYLRPPKEQVLEPFRQISFLENRICSFYRDVWNFIIILILLVAATYPRDIQMKYLQRSSIENVLFQSMPKTTKMLPSKDILLSWLETDFLDGFLAEHQCLSTEEDCGMPTNCIIVGSVILRHFYFSRCSDLNSDCTLFHTSNLRFDSDLGNIYERRSLRGQYGLYLMEDEWQVLSEQIFHSYDEVHDFVEKLNTSSAASLEFLLFNPTFSIFISVSFLFELTSVGTIALTSEILPVSISGDNSFALYMKIFLNLIFLIFILFTSKNHIWKMMKHKSQFWRQMWNYLSCIFILMYFIYLIFFVLYITMSEKVALSLINTQLSSNVNITEIAILETYLYIFVGILMFLHVLRCLKILSFSHRLKKLLKRLLKSQKKILITALAFFIIVLSCIVMIKYFIEISPSFSHPLFGFIKVITSLFKGYGKPEVSEVHTPIGQILSILISAMLIFIHIYLFSIIRSVLLNCESANAGFETKNITLHSTHEIIRKKFLTYFKPGSPQAISQIDYVPPVDFLLFELERLADLLVAKADTLFPDRNDTESFLKLECGDFKLNKAKFDLEEFVANAFELNDAQLDSCDSQERLIATIPRRNKGNLNSFMPPSFHTSLGSEKKYRASETSAISLQNRIRKTYPLSHLDSDSSSSGTTSQPNEKLDSVSSLLLRKTKSRGKGKNENFDLDIEATDCDIE